MTTKLGRSDWPEDVVREHPDYTARATWTYTAGDDPNDTKCTIAVFDVQPISAEAKAEDIEAIMTRLPSRSWCRLWRHSAEHLSKSLGSSHDPAKGAPRGDAAVG